MNNDIINYKILDIGSLDRQITKLNINNKNCYVLSCRLKGNAVFNTDYKSFDVKKGDILFIPKGANYSQYTTGEKIIFIHIDIWGNVATEFQHFSSPDGDYICQMFEKMYYLWTEKGENYAYKCTSLLYKIVAETSVTLPKEKKNAISPAVKYIEEHFCSADFSLENACKLCNVSRSYFNRIFKTIMKTTPINYINQLKISKAKLLLSSGAYTHNEIANLCGFSDLKYFYIVFKKITGTTAGKYQKTDEMS